MKKDSNMFNDNSIETEGVPADKTAEIPKVVDSTEEENAKKPLVLFGREFSRKQVCAAGAGILCAALLIGGGAYAISHASWTGDSNAPAVSQSKDDEKQDMVLTLEVKADGWDADTSTPVIAHIEDADGEVDFYTAIAANKQVTVKVGKSGTYTVTFISPVNADGSIYKVSSKKVTAGKADKKTASTGVTFNKVDADKVTKDDLTAIAKDVAAAVKKGDSTLTGDKGAEVVKKFEDNIKKNPNADADAVEKESEKAQETAKEDKSDAKKPDTSDNKKNDSGSSNGSKKDNGNSGSDNKSDSKPSGSNNSSNSGSSSKKDDTPAHQHNWVAQTKTIHHDAQYKTVHHDAQYKTVHHDAVTKTVHICNQCGQDITGNESAHFEASLLNGGNCGSWHGETRTVQAAYDEQVKVSDAKDEQVQVSDAWDETVTTGYKCSSCGATK
jgi:rubrerythrin